MRKKKKILILTTVMAPYRVELFDEMGKIQDISVVFEQKKDSDRDSKWYQRNHVNFKRYKLKGWDKPLKNIKWDVLSLLDRLSPDEVFIYEYSTPTAMLLMLGCLVKKIPYVINCDGGFVVHNPVKDCVKKFFIGRARAYIAGGKHAKKYLMEFGARGRNINVINFSSIHQLEIKNDLVTIREKEEIRCKLGIKEEYVVLMVGQMIYRKGIDVLLRACSKISSQCDVGVYIVGGKATGKYLSMSHGMNNVHFCEFVDNEALRQYYASADIFVLPTRDDVWGLVVNEAMAAGLPVITTNRCVAGLELIENGENGFIVPVEDSDMLAEKIDVLIGNSRLREVMGRNNLEKIRDYTIEGMAERIIGG